MHVQKSRKQSYQRALLQRQEQRAGKMGDLVCVRSWPFCHSPFPILDNPAFRMRKTLLLTRPSVIYRTKKKKKKYEASHQKHDVVNTERQTTTTTKKIMCCLVLTVWYSKKKKNSKNSISQLAERETTIKQENIYIYIYILFFSQYLTSLDSS